jgi:hypothetical protein
MITPALSADTTLEAARIQFDILQKIGIDGRIRMTFELSDNLRAITEAGVRQRHPDYDEMKVKYAVFRLTLGQKLFHEAFGDIEVAV